LNSLLIGQLPELRRNVKLNGSEAAELQTR
jgi:hypothetical protein